MQSRSLATRRVMKTIARRVADQPLPVRLADGTSPVVVALPEDQLVDIGDQVKRLGGHANVFVALGDGLALIDFIVENGETQPSAQPAHEATSMAMYVELLKLHVGTPCSVTVERGVSATAPSVRSLAYAF